MCMCPFSVTENVYILVIFQGSLLNISIQKYVVYKWTMRKNSKQSANTMSLLLDFTTWNISLVLLESAHDIHNTNTEVFAWDLCWSYEHLVVIWYFHTADQNCAKDLKYILMLQNKKTLLCLLAICLDTFYQLNTENARSCEEFLYVKL